MPTKRKSWSEEDMKKAVEVVLNKEMGYLKASKAFNVPKTTLERYVKDKRSLNELIAARMGRKPTLPEVLEKDHVKYCIDMEKRFYGLRQRDIKCMAYQLAIRNGVSHPFSVVKEIAGRKWLQGFLNRNKQLSIRSPEGISAARVKGFNAESIKTFFDICEPELEKIKCLPHRLFNVNETGITVVQHKHSKVLALKGKKQICSLTSMERGKLITVVTCMNASGTFVPPLIVFPRKNMLKTLMEGAPRGSVWACHPSGWIQAHIFTQWFSHFIKYTKPCRDDPVLLVLDGHYSHTRNVDVIDMAKENNVSIVCLPPHSTHKMQPLDVGFMSPLKTYYAQEIETWLKHNPGQTLPNTSVCKLLGAAYERAATMEVFINSFRKAGLFPCNRNIFREHDFTIHESNLVNVPSCEHVFERSSDYELGCESLKNYESVTDNITHNQSIAHSPRDYESITQSSRDQEPVARSSRQTEPVAHSSRDYEKSPRETAENIRKTSPEPITNLIGPYEITPPPQINVLITTPIKSRSQTAKLLTSTPYKNQLVVSQMKKKPNPKIPSSKSTKKAKSTKRTVSTRKKNSAKKPSKGFSEAFDHDQLPDLLDKDSEDEEFEGENDANCIFCSGRFSDDNHGEKWARCKSCYRWAHEDCGEVKDSFFLCYICTLVSESNRRDS